MTHIRTTLTSYARSEAIKALHKIFSEMNLTDAETNVVVSEIQHSLHMAQLRHERHPDDLTKGVNES